MTEFIHHFLLVRMKGLEPSRLAALAPEASVSTIPPHPHMIYFNIFVFIGASGPAPGHVPRPRESVK